MVVTGGDKELGNLSFIQVCANGKVSRGSERTEHQEDVVVLDKSARKVQGGRRIGFVVIRDKVHLTAVDPATLVDHLKIRISVSVTPSSRTWLEFAFNDVSANVIAISVRTQVCIR